MHLYMTLLVKLKILCSKSVILQILAKQMNMRNFNKIKSNQMAHLWMLLLSYYFFFFTCFLIVIVFKDLTSFNQVTNEFATRYADFQLKMTNVSPSFLKVDLFCYHSYWWLYSRFSIVSLLQVWTKLTQDPFLDPDYGSWWWTICLTVQVIIIFFLMYIFNIFYYCKTYKNM